jgi:hypothetical protein
LRAPMYSTANLRAWRDFCQDFDRAFVFFKHEEVGPSLAAQMLALD